MGRKGKGREGGGGGGGGGGMGKSYGRWEVAASTKANDIQCRGSNNFEFCVCMPSAGPVRNGQPFPKVVGPFY